MRPSMLLQLTLLALALVLTLVALVVVLVSMLQRGLPRGCRRCPPRLVTTRPSRLMWGLPRCAPLRPLTTRPSLMSTLRLLLGLRGLPCRCPPLLLLLLLLPLLLLVVVLLVLQLLRGMPSRCPTGLRPVTGLRFPLTLVGRCRLTPD